MNNSKGFYHEIPNMADDDLDVYSYRLYGHFRRVIGNNGEYCKESIRELAAACKMSTGKVSAARQDLKERGLIRIEDIPGPGKSIAGSRVYLVDIWAENAARYRQESHQDAQRGDPAGDQAPADRDVQTGDQNGEDTRSPHEHPRSRHERPRSPGERSLNNQKISKTTQKPTTHHQNPKTPQDSGAAGTSAVDDDCKSWDLIFSQIASWNLLPYAADKLRQRDPASALALIWIAGNRARDNPAGYLARMLQDHQAAPSDQAETARVALELGTGDQAAAEQALWVQQMSAQNAAYGFEV